MKQLFAVLFFFLSYPLFCQPFSEKTGIPVPGIMNTCSAWGDYDNDGDLDLLLCGETSTGSYLTKIYKNNPPGTFAEASIPFTNVSYGSVAWGDIDNDNDLDILLTGYNSGNTYTKIYRNNGSDSFTDLTSVAITGCYQSSGTFADYDLDGDLDMLISGYFTSEGNRTKLFRNNGDYTFTQVPVNVFANVSSGKNSWADFNKDGYCDVVITGYYSSVPVTFLYQNNRKGGFLRRSDLVLPGLVGGDAISGDYNSDGYPDLLLTGSDDQGTGKTVIVKNNPVTGYSVINLLSPGIEKSSAAWGDYDSDGDLDIIINGIIGSTYVSKVFRNDGSDTFTEQTAISLPGLSYGTADWVDIDNDRDLDIFLTGTTNSLFTGGTSKIYVNNSTSKNTLPASTSGLILIKDRLNSTFSWNPVKSDNTPYSGLTYNLRLGKTSGANDVIPSMSNAGGFYKLIAQGNCESDTSFTIKGLIPGNYYWNVQAIDNNFAGGAFAAEKSFTIDSIPSDRLEFSVVDNSKLKVKWRSGNGQRRILFCRLGSTATAYPAHNKTYTADPIFGQGDKISGTDWYCVYNGKGDSTFVFGLSPYLVYKFQIIDYVGNTGSEKYFRVSATSNNGVISTSPFTDQTNVIMTNMQDAAVAWGDYDNDGDLDLLLAGRGTGGQTEVYKNDGQNNFIKQTGIVLPGVSSGDVKWSDLDKDGDYDIILSGATAGSPADPVPITKFYSNNSGTFTEAGSITGIYIGALSLSDYDNDGDEDILISGATGGNQNFSPVSRIFRNNGNFQFIEQVNIQLFSVYGSKIVWKDFNNDGRNDILLTGTTDGNASGSVTKLYRNDGNNSFSEISQTGLPVLFNGSADAGDFDNDGDLDLLMTGAKTGWDDLKSSIYVNAGNFKFTELAGSSITGMWGSSVGWIDYNSDGKLDIIISGASVSGIQTNLYENRGGGVFEVNEDSNFQGISGGEYVAGDYDNDGDQDLLMSGMNYSKIYRNNLNYKTGAYGANLKPAAPANLVDTADPSGITLIWSSVKRDETSPEALTYNIRIGTSKNGSEVVPSHSNQITGYRSIVEMGNAQVDTTYIIRKLDSGWHYWQVQAIDQGYAGGTWSAIDSFEVRKIQVFFKTDTVCQGLPTHFTDQSVAADGIASWKWDFTDGTYSTQKNPVHTYSADGEYPVKLTVTSTTGDKDSLIQNVVVKIKPTAGFTAPNTCQGTSATITNTTNNNGLTISSWYWNFGDGTKSFAQQPPPHGYLAQGDYNVLLTALATNGCVDTTKKTVSVVAKPIAAITTNTPLSFCEGDSVILSVTKSSIYRYEWKLDGAIQTNEDSSRFVAKFPGKYTVKVANTTTTNCETTSDPETVTIKPNPFKPNILTDNYTDKQCPGDKQIRLFVDQPVTKYSYQWFRNGSPISSATLSSYQDYLDGGDYKVEVSLDGCRATSDIKKLEFPDAPLKPVLFAQNGPNVWYLVSSVNNAASYRWYFNGAIIPGEVSYYFVAGKNFGKYYVVISNDKGCYVRSDEVTIPTGTTGIDDIDPFEGLKIYPNPTTGLFTLEMDNQLFGDLNISVITETGQQALKIRSEKTTVNLSIQVDLSGQPKGIYFVKLQLDKYSAVKRVVVN